MGLLVAIISRIAVLTAMLVISTSALAAWSVKKSGSSVQVKKLNLEISEPSVKLQSLPEFLIEGPGTDNSRLYEETLYSDNSLPAEFLALSLQPATEVTWLGSEVKTLISQGPPTNRIDLTIVGDGYTPNEKQRFFEDAQRIADDLFKVATFSSYLPLFNVHAVFVPSKESGLTDRVRKNTALGLYRDPVGSKRAIKPGNTAAIERALKLAPDTDYPIIVANDDYYGGLGGRYAITTRSLNSGSMVLRHELGHNFGSVGEEYDGGSVYRGANHSKKQQVTWNHWAKGRVEVYPAKMISGDYVWQDLGPRPYKRNFKFPSGPYSLSAKISTVGWETKNDVHVKIDGQIVPLNGVFTSDRSFFDINAYQMSPGTYSVTAEQNISDNNNVLAYINLYAIPHSTEKADHHIGAYETFNSWGQSVGYRPTYYTCLMRNMRSNEFCAVDKENMWLKFLKRVSLIDSVDVQKNQNAFDVTVKTPDLPQLGYTWFRNGQVIFGMNSKTTKLTQSGDYEVEVRLITDEVRKTSSSLVSRKSFTL